MKALVFGTNGQVARELVLRQECVNVEAIGRDVADFTNPGACAAIAAATDADAIIIAAAYTAVDRAETEEALATTINAETPGAIARVAARRGLPLVHISTDYVFDGTGETPFAIDAAPGPLGAYGRSKLAGEAAVRAAGGIHGILRTSWVFSAHGSNFVRTMLRLGAERERLNVVADQIGGPTPAAAIADLCLRMTARLGVKPDLAGTYHLSGGSDTSWAGFAREIFARAGIDCAVDDVPSSAYPTPAARPLNSRLDNASTIAAFGLPRPDWCTGLDAVLATLRIPA